MKEYILLVRNNATHKDSFSGEVEKEFLQKCRIYIDKLKKDGRLISAQPIQRDGVLLSGSTHSWKEIPYNEHQEVIVGYYHILANDLQDAIEIAKGNPEFEYGNTARVEVRPIKMKEESTGYIYPKQ